MRQFLPLILIVPAAANANWPRGAIIESAAYVDITNSGLDSFEDILADLVPPTVSVDPFSQSGSLDIVFGSGPYYDFSMSDISIGLEVNSLNMTAMDEEILITMDLTLLAGTADEPLLGEFEAGVTSPFGGLDVFSETCNVWINPIDLELNARMKVVLVNSPDDWNYDPAQPTYLSVDGLSPIDEIRTTDIPSLFDYTTYSVDIDGGSVNSSSCTTGDIVEFVDDAISLVGGGDGLVGIIFNEIQPTLEDQISDLLSTAEDLVVSTTGSLSGAQEFDLLGSPLTLNLQPSAVTINPQGMRIEMDAGFDPGDVPHPCLSKFFGFQDDHLKRSRQTVPANNPGEPDYPFQNEGAPGFDHDLGILLNDDLLNQALYSVWHGGVLCQEISPDNTALSLPLPLNAALLQLIAGEAYSEYFDPSTPIVARTSPALPPYMVTDGEDTLNMFVDELGVDLYAELDGRPVRVMGLQLSAAADAGLGFTPSTGELSIDVDFDPSEITGTVIYNELAPQANETIVTNLGTLLENLIGPLLGDALTGLNFQLPSFAIELIGTVSELGVNDAEFAFAGPIDDFVGIYATLGDVPYSPSDDPLAGCGGGCNSGGSGLPSTLLLGFGTVFVLRRRRS